ncbi:MAG: hypothetical protein A3J40_06890 [Erythrobacter sp. RIFCSPHIGHO2_12_FULL_63_10]|nr:MAG: hypothetical protein A3J40_06890 [Erythrobacter sp. RIFCSPHIGHO2_12_FULL_63_10]
MSLFTRLFASKPDPRDGLRPLWQRVVAMARLREYYADCHVADTVSGRFDMVCAVLSLVMLRMEASSLRAQSAYLAELFVEDMEGQLREIGINDVVVGKRMGGLMSALGGRLGAIRTALAADGLVELTRVVERNVSFADAGSPLGVAERLLALHRELASLTDEALIAGDFGDAP